MKEADRPGILIISLDFELYWGVRDSRRLGEYKSNLEGVYNAIPMILERFHSYGIHATWATVGFLFHDNQEKLINNIPERRPGYTTSKYSPYQYISREDFSGINKLHFAPDLISEIAKTPGQEIGTHTYSHYYCLEDGQTLDEFKEDIKAALATARNKDLHLQSLVFPRNQFNKNYLKACHDLGIIAVRGNEKSWIYKPGQRSKTSLFRRAVRLMDAYLNLTGHHSYVPPNKQSEFPVNLPSSRFLRPVSTKMKVIEPLRLRRILNDMENAAKSGEVYHLWWHPHNFGRNLSLNIEFLSKILDKYKDLREKGHMISMSMGDYYQNIDELTKKAI